MEIINVHTAKSTLSQILAKVEKGEEFVIGRNGKPIAKLGPCEEIAPVKKPLEFGKWKDKIWIADDFNEPDPDVEALFYDGALFPEGQE
jgi:prevent-host-death family protein